MPFFRSSVRPTKIRSVSFSRVERAEGLGVGAVVDHRHVLLGHAEEALDLARGGVRHREDAREPRHHGLLHEHREVERALPLAPEARVDLEVGQPVDVQRVVDHRGHRRARRLQREQPPRQRLVVEHDVEAVLALQLAPAHEQAEAERGHLREDTDPRQPELPEVPGQQRAERVRPWAAPAPSAGRRSSRSGSRGAGRRAPGRAAAGRRSRGPRGRARAARSPARRRTRPGRRRTCSRDR